MGRKIVFCLDVVGRKGKPKHGVFYEFELVQQDGVKKKVWAYGVDHIMDPPTPVDLSPIKKCFPHLPNEVFAPKSMSSVDILIGNNFASLQPSGGQGRDSFEDLKVYQSLFGNGWVFSGTHPETIFRSEGMASPWEEV